MKKTVMIFLVGIIGLLTLHLSAASAAAAADELADGTYSIDIRVLKPNSNEISRMDEYVIGDETLSVRDGRKVISFTLKDSSSITGLKVKGNGALADVQVIREDQSNNTRDVAFEWDGKSDTLEAWVSIYIQLPGFTYDEQYDLRMVLDLDSIQPAEAQEPEQEMEQQPDPESEQQPKQEPEQPLARPESAGKEIVLQLDSTAIYSNGQPFMLLAAPYTNNGSTLVPLRFISEHLNADVQWDDSTRMITVSLDDQSIVLYEGNQTAEVNGESRTMETAPEIRDGLVFVTLRFISEQLGAEVNWNETDRTITIKK